VRHQHVLAIDVGTQSARAALVEVEIFNRALRTGRATRCWRR
jgi:hypothetical protein